MPTDVESIVEDPYAKTKSVLKNLCIFILESGLIFTKVFVTVKLSNQKDVSK